MSFTMEKYELLIRFTKDTEGKDITIPELRRIAWWRCVWGGWMAKAYYGIDDYYRCYEEVPEDETSYVIMTDDEMIHHFISCSGHPARQVMSKAMCKSVYGE